MAADPVLPHAANAQQAGARPELVERLRKRLRVKLDTVHKSRD